MPKERPNLPSPTTHRIAAILAIGLTLTVPNRVQSQAPVPDSPAIEQRVDAMIAKLSIEQKIDLIGGEDSMFIRAIPEINVPRPKMSDGPYGVRTWGPSTAYAAGVSLAATSPVVSVCEIC